MIKRTIAAVLAAPLLWQVGMAVTDPLAWQRRDDVVQEWKEQRTPMYVRVMSTYGNTPVDRITVKSNVRLRPAAIVVAGCDGMVMSNYAPAEAVVISVEETPGLLQRQSMVAACLARDPQAIEVAARDQLAFAIASLKRLALVDPDRTVLIGTGDAAPVMATVQGPFKAKLLFGDPCFIPWPKTEIDRRTPTTILRTDKPRGTAPAVPSQKIPNPSSDSVAAIQSMKDPRATIASIHRRCQAQPRVPMPPNFAVVEKNSAMSPFGPPTELERAAHAAFRDAVGKTFWRTTHWR